MSKLIIISSLLLLTLGACTSSRVELLKSPCAGAEGSPCGPKYPVNEWWMNSPKSDITV